MKHSETPGLIETLLRIFNNDLKHFKLCCILVILPTLAVFVLVMWVIKPTYAAKAVVTPPPESSGMNALSGMLGGEFSNYASMLGLSFSSVDADAIWTIFNSKELHDIGFDGYMYSGDMFEEAAGFSTWKSYVGNYYYYKRIGDWPR